MVNICSYYAMVYVRCGIRQTTEKNMTSYVSSTDASLLQRDICLAQNWPLQLYTLHIAAPAKRRVSPFFVSKLNCN